MKINIKHLIGAITAVGLFTLMTGAKQVHAADNGNPTFNTQAVLPSDNAKDSTFFDFKVTPNEQKTLSIKVSNTSSTSGKFDVTPNNAITNENGIIDYTQHVKKDKLLNIGFTDVLENAKRTTVTIPAKSTATVNFKMKMPVTKFDGIILGGFVVAPHDAVKNALANNAKAKKSERKTVVSTYQYVIGARIYQNTNLVTPKIGFTGVTYGLKHALPSVQIGIKNAAPTMVSIKTASFKITDSKDKKVFSTSKKNLSFAPNDSFNYFMSLNNKQLSTGKYTLHLKMTDSTGKNYTYDKSFNVTQKKAKNVSDKAADFTPKAKSTTNWTLVIIIAVIAVIVIVGLIAYIVASHKKMKKLAEEKSDK